MSSVAEWMGVTSGLEIIDSFGDVLLVNNDTFVNGQIYLSIHKQGGVNYHEDYLDVELTVEQAKQLIEKLKEFVG